MEPLAGPQLLLRWDGAGDRSRTSRAGAASVLLHVFGVVALLLIPQSAIQENEPAAVKRITPLTVPPREITQKDPNRGKIGKEFNVEALLPRPRVQVPQATPSTTRPAAPRPSPQPVIPATPLPEPPRIEVAENKLPEAAPAPAAPAPPVPKETQPEKPKIAFENVSAPPAAKPGGEIATPSSSVAEAVRSVARGGSGGGGIMVGDLGAGAGGIGEAMNLPPSPGRSGSALELLSDPMGIDFRPYLIHILANVRRNWWAVMPESALMGRRGRVAIQFAISRDGKVPKLVIVSPSGADPLDRAAVASISASNPFPPLPTDFKGDQIRLQFTFQYNNR